MHKPVLVLNANFEPINVCDIRRAIGLILSDKASMVLDGRGVINTVNRQFPSPSIIRLQKMVSPPRPRPRLSRREVFRRDNFTCQYCGRQTLTLTIDHVHPRHMGGLHAWCNVVAACPQCNHRKGGRTAEEAHMHPTRRPEEPPASAEYVFAHHLQENADWQSFITGW
jgi:5-methylcytosine-specific restriction endonuclease McrA